MLIENFNGARLKAARYYNLKSITQLANDLDISKQMVSKYENGKSRPSTEVFFKMLQVLKFPKDFFLGHDKVAFSSEGTFYRSLLTSTQKQKAPSDTLTWAATIYRDFLEKYIEFPELKKIDLDSYLPDFDLENGLEETEYAAKLLRNMWHLGDQPIPNMVNLLEKHGFLVVMLPKKMEKVDAFSSYRKVGEHQYYPILVSAETSFFKEQFSLAHELGHWLLHANDWDPQELTNNEYRKMEQQANNFASAFLLPRNQLKERFNTSVQLNDVFEQKKYFYVAGSAILYRLHNLGTLDDNQYLRLQKQISYHHFRKWEPYDDDYPIKESTTLKQATEMVVTNGLVMANQIPSQINTDYGYRFPNQMLARLSSLPDNYFDNSEGQKVLNLNFKA